MINENTKKCLLCLHIPFEEIVSLCEKLYLDDIKIAYEASEKASQIIQDAYIKDKWKLQGKSYKGLMMGAVYISGILIGHPKSQIKILRLMNMSEVTIKNAYRVLCDILYIKTEYNRNLFFQDYHDSYHNKYMRMLRRIKKL